MEYRKIGDNYYIRMDRGIQNYKIVTLCGSTRFKEQFLEAQENDT
jgi:hypothetical protein